ncbi:hypothetical protein V2J09_000265 [Rumex salicifolius]
MLRECLVIKAVWHKLLGHTTPPDFFQCTDVRTWVDHNIKKQDDWSTTFGNTLCFSDKDDHAQLHRIVSTMAHTYRESRSTTPTQPPSPPGPISRRSNAASHWSRPPMGQISLCIDGSSTGTPVRAGGGGIFRDHNGNFISAFSFQCGSCDALRAEI